MFLLIILKVTLFTQLLMRHIVKPSFNATNSLSHKITYCVLYKILVDYISSGISTLSTERNFEYCEKSSLPFDPTYSNVSSHLP